MEKENIEKVSFTGPNSQMYVSLKNLQEIAKHIKVEVSPPKTPNTSWRQWRMMGTDAAIVRPPERRHLALHRGPQLRQLRHARYDLTTRSTTLRARQYH